MLELYLAGARSAHDISEWASFLLAVPAYEFGAEGDERVQAVLWSLSAPLCCSRSPVMSYQIQRFRNGVAKVAAGLTPFGESVWPGVRNDLFLAHESIYRFFTMHASGKRVLDAGCGAGYGSYALAQAGALSVQGVDRDHRNI